MRELDKGRNPYVEQEFGLSGRLTAPPRIFSGDKAAAKRRKENRNRVGRQQRFEDMDHVVEFNAQTELLNPNRVNHVQERRTRGKGRKINPKQV